MFWMGKKYKNIWKNGVKKERSEREMDKGDGEGSEWVFNRFSVEYWSVSYFDPFESWTSAYLIFIL